MPCAPVFIERLRARPKLSGRVGKFILFFVDRGKGFFIPATGKITSAFQAALAENGFEAIMGDNASKQPGNLQELCNLLQI